MGIELEWFTLFTVHVLGTSIFTPFEVETPWWRLALKWVIVAGATVLVYMWAGHWALLVIAAAGTIGATVHFVWCRKHDIDPRHATPRRRYYELRGWAWHE